MRKAAWLILLLALSFASPAAQQKPPAPAPPPAPAAQTKKPSIVKRVELVDLVATVMNRRHKFVTDLDERDFRVLEDGKPQQIRFFSRQTDLPLRIAILLDTSNSIRERLRFEQDAAIDFLFKTMRRHKDMAFLMTFDNEPEVVQDYTGDLSDLTEAIQKQRAGGGTALTDAIYDACRKLMHPPLPPQPNPDVRRVLVVISDGEDNLSDHALSDAVEIADRAGVAIYSISSNTDWLAVDGESPEKIHKIHESRGDRVLQEYSEETGGRVFFPFRLDDLAQSFQDIGEELRSQYLIAYTPANAIPDGQFRTIRLEVDRKGLTVRTRKGYYATREILNPVPAPSGQ